MVRDSLRIVPPTNFLKRFYLVVPLTSGKEDDGSNRISSADCMSCGNAVDNKFVANESAEMPVKIAQEDALQVQPVK